MSAGAVSAQIFRPYIVQDPALVRESGILLLIVNCQFYIVNYQLPPRQQLANNSRSGLVKTKHYVIPASKNAGAVNPANILSSKFRVKIMLIFQKFFLSRLSCFKKAFMINTM